jgi:BMFP domain-containing protein YqiC
MHPSNFIESDRPTDDEVEAAARELHSWGELHGWYATSFDTLDPIGREEFEAIVERVLMAAAAAKRGIAPETP